jgi:hypothetical protein
VGAFVVVRPQDDAAAQQASDWCDELVTELQARGHVLVNEVDWQTPADVSSIDAAMRSKAELVCYFGHGAPDAWLTDDQTTIDRANVKAATGKAVASVTCLTGRELGPDAITSGVIAWLGFTIRVPALTPHKNADPFGEAIINGLRELAFGATMGDTGDSVVRECEQLVTDFDTGGRFHGHPAWQVGYYGALALKDHLIVNGQTTHRPLL